MPLLKFTPRKKVDFVAECTAEIPLERYATAKAHPLFVSPIGDDGLASSTIGIEEVGAGQT